MLDDVSTWYMRLSSLTTLKKKKEEKKAEFPNSKATGAQKNKMTEFSYRFVKELNEHLLLL